MLRFRNLASGSTGNATVVEAQADGGGRLRPSRLLVDCGIGIRSLQQRLAQAELQLEDLDAVFITHEHSDHTGCADKLAQRLGIPVWSSAGTRAGMVRFELGDHWREARDSLPFAVGDLQVMPFTVPHDAREPLQLSCSDGSRKLGILTDIGKATPHVLAHLQQCHALILECNHDPQLLAQSSYPYFLQQRIAGNHGHLANAAAAALLTELMHDALHTLVAAHLSEQNNRPEIALAALQQALHARGLDGDRLPTLAVADPRSGTGWYTV